MSKSEIFAKSWQPGEKVPPPFQSNTYRIEIGHDDGHAPNPYETISMVIKVAQDLLIECDIVKTDEEAKQILKQMIDTTQLKVEKRVST